MGVIGTALSMSLDGFIAGQDGGAGGLHDWLTDGETPSRFSPSFKMAAPSAEFFDEGVGGTGAVVAGRRTYDVSGAWDGRGPIPGLPLVVLTHRVPGSVPAGDPPYTFVTDGIGQAVERARSMAGGKNVHLMGASVVQQSIRAGLLDVLIISLVPRVLGRGVRLLDGLDAGAVGFEVVRVIDAPGVTHLTYRVIG
ncbi:MAG TPA: dihydrofolate reductase family protein [Trebonia sp.]|jgi:dihydrofolate reductase